MTATPNDNVTVSDLQRFGEALSKQIVDDIIDVLKEFMTHIDNRFNKVEARLDRVEIRLDGVEERLDRVETRLDKVNDRLNKLEAGQVQLTKMIQTTNRIN